MTDPDTFERTYPIGCRTATWHFQRVGNVVTFSVEWRPNVPDKAIMSAEEWSSYNIANTVACADAFEHFGGLPIVPGWIQ